MKKFHVIAKCSAKEPHEACLPVRADDEKTALAHPSLAADGRFGGVCHVSTCSAKVSLRAEPAKTYKEQLADAGVRDGFILKQWVDEEVNGVITKKLVDVVQNDLTAALADAAARGLDEYGEPT